MNKKAKAILGVVIAILIIVVIYYFTSSGSSTTTAPATTPSSGNNSGGGGSGGGGGGGGGTATTFYNQVNTLITDIATLKTNFTTLLNIINPASTGTLNALITSLQTSLSADSYNCLYGGTSSQCCTGGVPTPIPNDLFGGQLGLAYNPFYQSFMASYTGSDNIFQYLWLINNIMGQYSVASVQQLFSSNTGLSSNTYDYTSALYVFATLSINGLTDTALASALTTGGMLSDKSNQYIVMFLNQLKNDYTQLCSLLNGLLTQCLMTCNPTCSGADVGPYFGLIGNLSTVMTQLNGIDIPTYCSTVIADLNLVTPTYNTVVSTNSN